jgi:hypothetical protein
MANIGSAPATVVGCTVASDRFHTWSIPFIQVLNHRVLQLFNVIFLQRFLSTDICICIESRKTLTNTWMYSVYTSFWWKQILSHGAHRAICSKSLLLTVCLSIIHLLLVHMYNAFYDTYLTGILLLGISYIKSWFTQNTCMKTNIHSASYGLLMTEFSFRMFTDYAQVI